MKLPLSPLGELLYFSWSLHKVTKQKDAPYRLFPALLGLMGGNRKLAKKITWLKQPLAENSHETV